MASDTIDNPGLIIAGNNANGTKGVSNTTLTGRQWGIGPRIGAAWQPGMFHNKVVVRTGGGIYYDRGELFSYFSPGYAIGTVTGGPFGVNQQLPFVNASSCPAVYAVVLRRLHPHLRRLHRHAVRYSTGDLANPYGTSLLPRAQQPQGVRPGQLSSQRRPIINYGGQPISLGVYDRTNKLPYTINYTLDIQWQPRNDLAIELGYIGNLGRHQVIPVPFNQPNIASPANPRWPAAPSSRTTATATTWSAASLDPGSATGTGYLANYEGGNVDLRVPYIGYAAESIAYKAAGVDAITPSGALRKAHEPRPAGRRLLHLFARHSTNRAASASSTTATMRLTCAAVMASADFDRTHVINFNYVYQLPSAAPKNYTSRQGSRRLVARRTYRTTERPALQRHRLLRRHRQHRRNLVALQFPNHLCS